MQVVGARLEEARKLRGMSQTKLSRLIGTSPSQVSMIEHDQSGTSMRSAIAAAKVLNVSLDYLVGFARDPRPAGELATLVGRQTAGELDQKVMEEDHDEADVEDFVGVHEIIASAGTGSEVINERITGPHQVPAPVDAKTRAASEPVPDREGDRRGAHSRFPGAVQCVGKDGL